MKKLYIFISLFALSLIAIIMIAIFAKEKKTISCTVFEKSYNLVSEFNDSDELKIELFINDQDSLLTNMENFENVYICDLDDVNRLQVELLEINQTGETQIIKKEKFYNYDYIFKINFVTEGKFSFEIKDAYLKLKVLNENISIKIGSFSLYKVPSFENEDIMVTKLKGIVNDIDDLKTLIALQIELKNKSNDELKVIDIIPLDVNLKISNLDVININNKNYNVKDDIKEVLGYEYSIEGTPLDEPLTIKINPNSCSYNLFPLKYSTKIPVNSVGFIIIYEIDNMKKEFYYNEFTYFSSYEYSNSQINDLIIYTYENN